MSFRAASRIRHADRLSNRHSRITELHVSRPKFGVDPLAVLLILIPVALVFHASHAAAPWVFATAAGAIVPLAAYMGRATEHLAGRMGSGIGGLLNATFGNAAELIIALMALK